MLADPLLASLSISLSPSRSLALSLFRSLALSPSVCAVSPTLRLCVASAHRVHTHSGTKDGDSKKGELGREMSVVARIQDTMEKDGNFTSLAEEAHQHAARHGHRHNSLHNSIHMGEHLLHDAEHAVHEGMKHLGADIKKGASHMLHRMNSLHHSSHKHKHKHEEGDKHHRK